MSWWPILGTVLLVGLVAFLAHQTRELLRELYAPDPQLDAAYLETRQALERVVARQRLAETLADELRDDQGHAAPELVLLVAIATSVALLTALVVLGVKGWPC